MDDEEPATEAEKYFAALDYALTSKGVIINCNNCGYPMDHNETHLHMLSRGRKCSTEMAMQIAHGTTDILKGSSVPPSDPPKAFVMKKPSWFQRLLDRIP